MKAVTVTVLLALFLAGIKAAPMCFEDSETGGCKVQQAFHEVDCAEKLKFKHAQASCFMNDKTEFIILGVNNRQRSKRSIVSDEKSLYSPYGGKVLVRRLKRSLSDEDDFRAEVLSSNTLRDLLNKQMDLATENPLVTNEVPTGTGTSTSTITPNTDDDPHIDRVKGVIFIIASVEGGNNEITDSKETSPSQTGDGDEDLGETLFGLLLLGAILDELQKHQIENPEKTFNTDM